MLIRYGDDENSTTIVSMFLFPRYSSSLRLLCTLLVFFCFCAHAAGRSIRAVEQGAHSLLSHRAKRRHAPAQNNITFGIILSAFERENDANFRLPCVSSFYSIARQTYKDWLLIVNGDGISSEGIGRMFRALKASGVPEEKVLFRDMDNARRERFKYNDQNDEHWMFSGVNSVNMALEVAYDLAAITHVARLDEDDVWLPSHLENLAEAYRRHPTVGFVYTQSMGYRHPFRSYDTWHAFPRHGAALYMLQPPVPCDLIHSATSWTTNLRIFYRQLEEQRQHMHNRSMETCCEKTCNGVLPADADLWERIHGLVRRGDLVSLLVSRADVLYTTGPVKAKLLEVLSGKEATDTGSLDVMNEREDLPHALEACRDY